jgi:hypothetical protein
VDGQCRRGAFQGGAQSSDSHSFRRGNDGHIRAVCSTGSVTIESYAAREQCNASEAHPENVRHGLEWAISALPVSAVVLEGRVAEPIVR